MFKDKLIITNTWFANLLIYSCEGRYLSTITIDRDDTPWDAVWTFDGNIVLTTWVSNKVVLMSESGKVITTNTQMTRPLYLSVSNDYIIYIADLRTGVYQSTDNGVSWGLIFKSTDEWWCVQVIDVTINNVKDLWILEGNNFTNEHRLSVYSVSGKHTNGNEARRNINVPKINGKLIELSRSVLSYDGNMNIFLNDYDNKAVHILSVNDQYRCQLHSLHHLKYNPRRSTVDKERQLLYVVQESSVTVVEVLTLTYANG